MKIENRMTSKCVLLLSGGLDSGALLFWALNHSYEILPLYVNYGQVPFPGEWQSVKNILNSAGLSPIIPLSVQEVSTIGSGTLSRGVAENNTSNQYFPSRNLFLLCLAAMYAYKSKSDSILIGLIGDTAETLPDCSYEFIKRSNSLMKLEYPNIQIEAPFIKNTKISIVKEAMKSGFNPNLTFCCNRLPDHHCWLCPSCVDRKRVFSELGFL